MALLSYEWWQIILFFLPALLNLWGIWHASSHEFSSPLVRLGWMAICVLLPVVGGLMYLFIGRRYAKPMKKVQ